MKITIICFGNLILTGHIGTVMHIYRWARDFYIALDWLVKNDLKTIFVNTSFLQRFGFLNHQSRFEVSMWPSKCLFLYGLVFLWLGALDFETDQMKNLLRSNHVVNTSFWSFYFIQNPFKDHMTILIQDISNWNNTLDR